MSITSALNSALSGLTANARQAATLSSNVANATTPGYARRSVSLSAAILGGSGQGVTVNGITRDVDLALLNDRRAAQAAATGNGARSEFLARLEGILGDPEDQGSLTARINALDTSLVEAASHPESEARLAAVANAARSLASGLNSASDAIQAERENADRNIAAAVEALNTALAQVCDLNTEIRAFTGAGRDASALLDQRQQVVDRIAGLVPVQELPREHNQIALMTTGGAMLLDGTASEFGFTAVNTIVPEMTLESGALSGLTLNGKPMATAGAASLVQGGELAALFAVRDDLATGAQAKLDALALDLYDRFADPAVDPTLAAGEPGLFTDGGGAWVGPDATGLAARITLNALADLQAGGSVLRLRDGLAAMTTGPSGDATILLALSEALTAVRPATSTAVTAAARSLPGLAADILSSVSTARLSAEQETAFATARHTALRDLEAADGVDIDAEMQSLLVIEQNYAANARVIQAVDEMISTLLGM
jgi:flagellar hook-associated protein 1 FlgK